VLETESYVPADPYFGAPYIDVDEERQGSVRFRHVHGGFADTDTRFLFSFPLDDTYTGRAFHPLEGAHAGHEDAFGGPMGDIIGGLGMIARLGGYMIESNSGHIGDDVDPRAGDDPALYGHRASIESARFSKHIAAQVYGEAPHHTYVFGGSGGGRRSPMCLEYGNGVYDGALPFMGGGNVEPHGTTSRVRSAQPMVFAAMFNAQRVLGEQLDTVVDAMAPGGSGDPFEGLSIHQRGELDALYRLGYPRGDEAMISNPMGQAWLWTSIADMLQEDDAAYFENFWTKPGYVGHDEPWYLEDDLIDLDTTVERVVTATDLASDPAFAGPEFDKAKPMAMLMASMGGMMDLPIAVQVAGLEKGYKLGAGVRIMSGAAEGRSLYVLNSGGNVLFCDGHGEANLQRFRGVQPGDRVHVSNRAFLAYCYYYRHHITLEEERFEFLALDGVPRYPQHGIPVMSPLMGVPYSGQYEGKLLWVHHTHDNSLWPPEGVIYEGATRAAQGEVALAEKFRIRWSDNAEHVPPFILPTAYGRASNTWLIDYTPIIEQSLTDLTAWVEDGIEPAGTTYNYDGREGRVTLPATAAERGGIQPVVNVTANGGLRADVRVGETVTLEVVAETPPGAGGIIAIAWDFDGSGAFPEKVDGIDGIAARVASATTHAYDAPGTYYVTALVHSHRDGDVAATSRRLPNLAQARVVVTA
jgi:prepilin-type processing-associated H-X9-DG protein